jgi:hypothetical protein
VGFCCFFFEIIFIFLLETSVVKYYKHENTCVACMRVCVRVRDDCVGVCGCVRVRDDCVGVCGLHACMRACA